MHGEWDTWLSPPEAREGFLGWIRSLSFRRSASENSEANEDPPVECPELAPYPLSEDTKDRVGTPRTLLRTFPEPKTHQGSCCGWKYSDVLCHALDHLTFFSSHFGSRQDNQCSFLLQGKEGDGDRPRCWLFLLALNPFGGRQMKQLLDEAKEVTRWSRWRWNHGKILDGKLIEF